MILSHTLILSFKRVLEDHENFRRQSDFRWAVHNHHYCDVPFTLEDCRRAGSYVLLLQPGTETSTSLGHRPLILKHRFLADVVLLLLLDGCVAVSWIRKNMVQFSVRKQTRT